MSNFDEELNEIADRLKNSNCNQNQLEFSIQEWCNSLSLPEEASSYIKTEFENLFAKELIHPMDQNLRQKAHYTSVNNFEISLHSIRDVLEKIPIFGQYISPWINSLNQSLKSILNRMNPNNDIMKTIVLIAFAITAIGYGIYLLNKPKNQTTRNRNYDRRSPSDPPYESITSTPSPELDRYSPPTVIPKTQQILVLVIPISKQSVVNLLQTKATIELEDCESLYEATQYLCQAEKAELEHKISNINKTQFEVQPGTESEYDVYLVQLTLKQKDDRFNPDVNQIERYDAFQNLPDLVTDVKISPRLTMDAYSELDVYVR